MAVFQYTLPSLVFSVCGGLLSQSEPLPGSTYWAAEVGAVITLGVYNEANAD